MLFNTFTVCPRSDPVKRLSRSIICFSQRSRPYLVGYYYFTLVSLKKFHLIYAFVSTFLSLEKYLVTCNPTAVTPKKPVMMPKGRSASKGTGYIQIKYCFPLVMMF